jgi:oligopeptide transport system substrate-binding protein
MNTMNSKRYVSLAVGLVLLLSLLVSSFGVVSAQDDKVLYYGRSVGGDLNTIDPSLSEVADEIQVIEQLFVGLTAQNELDGALEGSMASSWDLSDDGLTYTFHLVDNVPWVRYNADSGEVEQVMDENGEPRFVNANDFLYGWERTLNPETAGVYAFLPAGYVVGGDAYMAGEGSFEDVAVKALDDFTIEITQSEPVGFAPYIYGLWMVRALPQWAIDEGGDEWTEPEYINSYGPFVLTEWQHDVSLTLVKNPLWPGTSDAPQPMIDEVVYQFLDPQASLAEYEAGSVDAIAAVPVEEMDRVKSDSTLSQELSISPRDCTYYLGYDNTEEPLSNSVHMRRALSYAIDRQAIIDNITKGDQVPAQWFSRPGLIGAPTLDTHPDLGMIYDTAMAEEEFQLGLEELGLGSADDMPTLTLAYNDSSNHGQIMQAIQQMWADTLGIEVQLTGMDPTTYFTSVSEDAPQIYRAGWCSDYPDADNFLRGVFRSDSDQNDAGFASEEFDALVDEARQETDLETRRELYAQADNILVLEQPGIIPVYWYTFVQLTKPYVERTYPALGYQRWAKWDITE